MKNWKLNIKNKFGPKQHKYRIDKSYGAEFSFQIINKENRFDKGAF